MARAVVAGVFALIVGIWAGQSSAEGPAPPPFEGTMGQFIEFRPLEPAPTTTFLNADRDRVSLSDFSGKVVLLNFWATWCAPCIREMPSLDRLQAKLGGKDFAVVAISLDRMGVRAVKPFYRNLKLTNLAIYADRSSKIFRRLGGRGLPTTFLIDRNGNKIGMLEGPAEWDSPEAISLIRHYLKDGRLHADSSGAASAGDG